MLGRLLPSLSRAAPRALAARAALPARAFGAKADAPKKLISKEEGPGFDKDYGIELRNDILPSTKSIELCDDNSFELAQNTINFYADYNNSLGNYISDMGGNRYLDVYASISSISIGYNNPYLLRSIKENNSHEWASAVANRPALGVFPDISWRERVKDFMSVAPTGMARVVPMMCGSCSVENAIKMAMMYTEAEHRSHGPPAQIQLDTCMRNSAPGSPDLAVLSFSGAFHGRTLGALSLTRSKPIHKLDIPAFHWPVAPFPELKYPLAENVEANAEAEAQCLDRIEYIIKNWPKRVAAMIIEPIQGEGGDREASVNFYRTLRQIALDNDVAFIVDEVQTGAGPTGKFWAHEHWELETPPDFVTFAKKMQTAGLYHSAKYSPKEGFRVFNTWMGDPVRALCMRTTIEYMREFDLVNEAARVGKILKDGIEDIASRHPDSILNVRGRGTFLAWDAPATGSRDRTAQMRAMLYQGVNVAACGSSTIRLRPMLIFSDRQAAEFLGALDRAMVQL